ncbi:MAG: helix-turn-helix domain-containing protein [Burkholderiales bacterium]|nr:helix-turn-helix domain-containing protein [Burkholderiales bacterium]
MPNIASILKEEIARVARKETRGETQSLKKASAQYRGDIALLKRRIQALEQQVKRLGKAGNRAPAQAAAEEGGTALRFSAKGLAAQRRRLGLSAAAVATLLGVSGQSVYKWEDGKTRPRASQIAAIATLRKMSKKQAAARLEELGG